MATVPAWVGFATAAAVLLAVSIGSYFFYSARGGDTPAHDPEMVRQDGPKHDTTPEKNSQSAPLDRDAVIAKGPDKPSEGANPEEKPAGSNESDAMPPQDRSPAPPGPVLAFPTPDMEMFQPQKPDVDLGVILNLADLDLDKFAGEVKKASALRLELPCHEAAKAFARVEAALKDRNTGLLVDQNAQLRLKMLKYKTNYVFFIEDLTQEELAALLQQLGGDDKKAEAKHKGDGQFDKVMVNRMTEDDHKQLAQLLGVDLRTLPVPKAGAPLKVDPSKPLSDTTGTQVVQTLTGQGGTPRPDPSKPTVKPPDRMALALAYNPVRPTANSAEVKRFLDSRKPPRGGTLQVLLVLREM
jgi:hypothetical protein